MKYESNKFVSLFVRVVMNRHGAHIRNNANAHLDSRVINETSINADHHSHSGNKSRHH